MRLQPLDKKGRWRLSHAHDVIWAHTRAGNRFGIHATGHVNDTVIEAVTSWARYAEAAEVPKPLAQRIEKTLRIDLGQPGKNAKQWNRTPRGGSQFRDSDDAVLASLELVENTPSLGLQAHIGVNTGLMLYDEGDYFGRTINMAARIASQAGPGQIYVGESVVEHVTGNGFDLNEVGEFELKGIARPVRIFQALRSRTRDALS